MTPRTLRRQLTLRVSAFPKLRRTRTTSKLWLTSSSDVWGCSGSTTLWKTGRLLWWISCEWKARLGVYSAERDVGVPQRILRSVPWDPQGSFSPPGSGLWVKPKRSWFPGQHLQPNQQTRSPDHWSYSRIPRHVKDRSPGLGSRPHPPEWQPDKRGLHLGPAVKGWMSLRESTTSLGTQEAHLLLSLCTRSSWSTGQCMVLIP